jgi:hypothetical protein
MQNGSAKIVLLLGMTAAPVTVVAQNEANSESGLLLHERISGSGSVLGLVTKFDTAVGYQFNRYLAVEAGLPVYAVNPSSTASEVTGVQAASGIGNVYADLRLSLLNPAVNFTSLLTAAVPTGDKSAGFSTGHVTYDWSNLFDRSFGPVTPFVDLGIANTITDTPFFIRPFTSYGFVTHLEGGASYKLWRIASVGASVYAIEPSGQQTVFSKLIPGKSQNPGAGNQSRGRHGQAGVFETDAVTVGNADITRDHGFSAWFSVRASKFASFEIGYSRSVEYALNSIFFGIDFNLSPVIRRVL